MLRYNPYTQTVEVLNNSDKILDMAKELKGDLAIVASALRKVQEREGELDPSVISTFLTAGLDISPYGSRYCSNLPSQDLNIFWMSLGVPLQLEI